MKLRSKILALFMILTVSLATVASASAITFTDDDLGGLLNKVYTFSAASNGYAQYYISGTNGGDNMVDSTAMNALLTKSMLHISFDYKITDSGKKGMRVEMRFDGETSSKTNAAVNPYWSGWQYDANAEVTPNTTHHFEGIVNVPEILKDTGSNAAGCKLFVAGLGETLNLSNIKIREWSTEGTNLGLFSTNIEEYNGDNISKPEGYTGKVYHLTDTALVKSAVRVVSEDTYAFAANTQYTVEFWYKTNAENAKYFAMVNKSNKEYSKIDTINTENEWTKGTFTFTPDADMNGTYANYQKNDASSSDILFTEWVVLPKAPVSNTVAVTDERVMITDGATVNLEGYFTAPESIVFTNGSDEYTATKSTAAKDFAGYTKAEYTFGNVGAFDKKGTYTATITDSWGVDRTVSVWLAKYSDEARTLNIEKAKWTNIYSNSTGITVGKETWGRIDENAFPSLKSYVNSDCAMFKVEFKLAITGEVNDDTVTEVTMRTGKDVGHTVFKVNNSELTTTPKAYTYIDNQSSSKRYVDSNKTKFDRFNSNQWWFFVRNKNTAQTVNVTDINVYVLKADVDGDVLLGKAKLENLNTAASKPMDGTLIFAEYDAEGKLLTAANAEKFELKDTQYDNDGVTFTLDNGVKSNESKTVNAYINYNSGSKYKLFWIDSDTIEPLTEAVSFE